MGIVEEELWKCKNCGFEFYAQEGCYEADPNDFGTTHVISAYHCYKCGNIKNVATCASFEKPLPGNENLCRHDSDKCENCGTQMHFLEKTKFKFFKRYYKCPQCGKRTLRFIKICDEIWT